MFDIVVQTAASLGVEAEPSNFISEFDGIIRYDRDGERFSPVGKIHAYRINAARAADHGESLFEVCDAHSHELHVLHTLLYEPGEYCFKEPLARHFDAIHCDTLLLDYVVLSPKWRGLKLGLLAVRKLVDMLGSGCGLVVTDIAPLASDAHRTL